MHYVYVQSTLNTARDVKRQLQSFADYLKNNKLKVTNQRLMVAEYIFQTDTHFTVDSLADELKSHKTPISRATLYRIISVLVEAGLLTEHNFAQDSKRYEHIPHQDHHDHIICQDCGKISEFVNPEIEKLQLEIAKKNGFILEDHKMNLYGRCIQLKTEKKCPHKK